MTSKIVTFPDVPMTMVIKRLTDYTVQHYSGLDDIPHLCVKVRHHNGFAWFGISIIPTGNYPNGFPAPWPAQLVRNVKTQFLQAMAQVIDLAEMDSDVDLLMRSIQDICAKRKRPVMFGTGGNEFIQISSTNNVQIELYRDEVKPESSTYGGYFFVVEYDGQTFPGLLYHRGIIAYNYITKEAAHGLIREELQAKFPEFFNDPSKLVIPFGEIMQLPRNRNKWAKVR
ncbi:hypothetical protein ST201phi2-1p423 [Pseudomonas phage 201phi2-1]|uniref:Uncharacterized protein n=1 Tax=Pseudomonas phage 201phi2-1 TaxID=198110 RepID=B3FJT1_BP201|nr:hypothetical protein ST201phi2-1p423 [Pseudomonas phage 201phi2-1]ABY63246.1 hypothetical protein 201phi2-1p423 [Pseudomonas phage 201phi2-1]